MFKTPKDGNRQRELKIINSFCNNHDLCCDCESPLFHCWEIISKQLKKEITEDQKKQIKKCLGMEEEDGTVADTEDIGEDLEKLFDEDFGEEDTG